VVNPTLNIGNAKFWKLIKFVLHHFPKPESLLECFKNNYKKKQKSQEQIKTKRDKTLGLNVVPLNFWSLFLY